MVYRFYRALRSGAPFVLSLLRIVTALVLMEHGTQKLIDFPPMPRFAGFPGAAAGPVPGGTEAVAPTRAGAAVGGRADAVPAQTPGAVSETTPAAPAAPGAASTTAPQGNAANARPAAGGGTRGGGPGGGGPGGFRGPPAYLFPIAGWIETVAGALLVVGLFTRSAAFLLSGETAVVYFIAHAPMSFFPAVNGGAEPALFAWTFLYVFFAGPGPISLDALWRRMQRRGAVRGEPVAAAAG